MNETKVNALREELRGVLEEFRAANPDTEARCNMIAILLDPLGSNRNPKPNNMISGEAE